MAFPVGSLSGTDRGQPQRNWYPYRGQQCVRLPPVSPAKYTLGQRNSRAAFRQAVEGYDALTLDEARAWETWSRVALTTQEGRGRWPAAKAAYVGVNWIRRIDGEAVATKPPEIGMPYVCTEVVSVVEILPNFEWTIKWFSSCPAGIVGEYQILLSNGFASPVRRARKTDMRSFGGLGQDVVIQTRTGPGEHTASRENMDLKLVAGDFCEVWMRIHSVDYWPGRWRKFRTSVLA